MAEGGRVQQEERREVRAARTPPPARITSPTYEEALRAQLQTRLRVATIIVASVGAILFVVDRFVDATRAAAPRVMGLDAGAWVHLGGVAAVLGLHLVLRRRRRMRVLHVVDAAVTLLVVGVALAVLHTTYDVGNRPEVEFVGLLLVARAVAVPGGGIRAFLLSVTAPIGVLAVEWWHGVGASGIPAESRAGLREVIIWDQAYLWLSVALAAWASRANAALRRRAFEAGQVDQYVLGERIGGGGMGEVFRATHALMRRPTALKLLRPDIADEHTISRFEQEVRQTARLTHPNTIAIYDYGHTADGAFYYAMELLEGADLERIVETTGPFSAARTIHCLVQACGSLAEAHASGLVHRDVKPSNLILTKRGLEWDVVKVMDFGLVKETGGGRASLTGAGEICGSPYTIAPEALRGEPVGPTADVYALGAVGCYLLTGRQIFDVRTVPEFVAGHLNSEPVRPSARVPSVPADLEAVLLRCLAKEPEDRYPNVAALRDALLDCRDAKGWGAPEAALWWSDHAATFDGQTRIADGLPVSAR